MNSNLRLVVPLLIDSLVRSLQGSRIRTRQGNPRRSTGAVRASRHEYLSPKSGGWKMVHRHIDLFPEMQDILSRLQPPSA